MKTFCMECGHGMEAAQRPKFCSNCGTPTGGNKKAAVVAKPVAPVVQEEYEEEETIEVPQNFQPRIIITDAERTVVTGRDVVGTRARSERNQLFRPAVAGEDFGKKMAKKFEGRDSIQI
jgi:hypothetical protein